MGPQNQPGYWPALAEDYARAYLLVYGKCATREALELAMSVAQHETCNGEAWPGSFNFGAVQLRQLTLGEQADYKTGLLKAGDRFAGQPWPGPPGGELHVDTHPTPQGPQPYPIWFAAFPDRVSGIAYFVRALWRLSSGVADSPGCTAQDLAEQMYLHGYYEGAHAGGRPLGKRYLPLTPPEAANVADYATAVDRCLQMIVAALGSWESPDIHEVDTLPDLDAAPHR
jgi:hypothetical protein